MLFEYLCVVPFHEVKRELEVYPKARRSATVNGVTVDAIICPWQSDNDGKRLRLLGLHHSHLLAVRRLLSWIRRRGPLLIRRIHVVIHVRRLSMRILCSVLVHLHVGIRSILSCLLLSLLLGNSCLLSLLSLLALFAHAFISLLLLHTRSR